MCFELLLPRVLLGASLLLVAPTPTPSSSLNPPLPAPGKVFLTVEEALELAFPKCAVERGTEYFKLEHKQRVAKLAGSDYDKGILHPYVAKKDGKLIGTAYFDTHTVRSLRETLMFVIAPDGTIARVEVLAFGEPLDYLPRDKWYAQFLERKLDDELTLGRGIRNLTGATLSARSATRAVREVLACHQVLREIAEEQERERKKKRAKKGKGPKDGEPRARRPSSGTPPASKGS